MNKQTTFDSIETGKLFFLAGVGPCRKTGNMTAEDKKKNERVVYPKDAVSPMNHKKKA